MALVHPRPAVGGVWSLAIFGLGLALVVALLAGKALLGAASPGYLALVHEDGPAETAESLLGLLSAALAVAGLLRLRQAGEAALAVIYGLIAFALVFIALEEISWGQRLFDIASPAFFETYNRQAELNLHNLGPVQVVLNFAYLAVGGIGGFGWSLVSAVRRLHLAGRTALLRGLARAAIGAVLAAALLAVVAGFVLTPSRVLDLGLADPSDPALLQLRLAHLAEYRQAAVLFGAVAAAAALAGLHWFGRLWRFCERQASGLARFLVPGWPFASFFVPMFLFYLAEIFAGTRVEGAGLWGFVVLADEEAVEFLVSLGVALFLATRLRLLRKPAA